MRKKFNERTRREKIIYIVRLILQIALAIVALCLVVLRVKTGEHIPMPLIGCILLIIVGLFRIGDAHSRHQGSEEECQKFNKIVVRSIILAPIIAVVFIAIVFLIKLKT